MHKFVGVLDKYGKGHNYLGGKRPKFAIFEILSLLFS